MAKSFSVAMNLGEKGRENYDRIFGKRRPSYDMKCACCGNDMLSVSADCRASSHGRPAKKLPKKKAAK